MEVVKNKCSICKLNFLTYNKTDNFVCDRCKLKSKKGQMGTVWFIFILALLLVAFIVAVPPDIRLALLS